MFQALRADSKIMVDQDCSHCGGTGMLDGTTLFCAQCGATIYNGTPDFSNPAQPCGCPWSELRVQDHSCAECEGKGEIKQFVTLAELAAALRQIG